MEMVNQETEEQVWMGWILTLSLELCIKSIIKYNKIPNAGLLVLMMRVYYSSRCKELINPLIGLLYINCFKNPFENKTEMHWLYSNGDYVKLIHLPIKLRNIAKVTESLGTNKVTNSEIPPLT